jgi:hypothetical protein
MFVGEETQMSKTMFGGAIKRVEGNPSLVEGYLVKFDNVDLYGEIFSKSTDFNLAGFPIVGKPLLYNHGLDEAIKSVPIGVFTLAKVDDVGIWVQAQLHQREEYEKYLEKRLVELGESADKKSIQAQAYLAYTTIASVLDSVPMGFSSGALPQSVQIVDKHIKTWCIIEGSITPTPAEPTGTPVSYRNSDNSGSAQVDNHEDNRLINTEDKTMKYNQLKTDTRKALDAEKLSQLQALLAEIIAEMGTEAGNVTAAEVAMAMEEDTERMLDEDETKMSDEMDKEDMKAFIRNVLAKESNIETIVNKVLALRQYRKSAIQNAIALHGESFSKARSGAGVVSQQPSQMVDRRYDHMTATDMAMGYMMLKSAFPVQPSNPLMVVSEDYWRAMCHKSADYAQKANYKDPRATSVIKNLPYRANELNASNIANQGAEWVPIMWEEAIWNLERQPRFYDSLIAKGMREYPVTDSAGGSVYIPTEESGAVTYSRPQARNIDTTGRPEVTARINPFKTGRILVTPGELVTAVAFTDILREDSIINVASQTSYELEQAMLEARDELFLNGDVATAANTNINLIDGTPGTGNLADYYLTCDGLRKLALVTSTPQSRVGGASLIYDDFLKTIGLLPYKQRNQLDKMMFFLDPDTQLTALGLPQLLDPMYFNTNRYGTIQNGVLTKTAGVDVFTTEFMLKTTPNGKISATPANNTKGTIALAFAPYWAVAYRRAMTLETGRDILSGTNIFVMTTRMSYVARGNNAGALTYNVTTV